MKAAARWLVILFLPLLATLAKACCLAYGATPVSLIGEKVIIIWDQANKLEHFIREASFKGDAKDFGFIVPTPTKPDVAKADAKAFDRLQRLIPPESHFQLGCAKKSEDAASFTAAAVDVIDQFRVGDYLATILQATDGKSLLSWLSKNHYQSRPAMESWLDHYAKQNWFFTALKFVREPDQTTEATSALRISFKADTPHYPYKMPDDTWPEGHYRPLSLFFIGPDEATGLYRGIGKDWEAKTIWSGDLPTGQVSGLASELSLKPEDIPEGSVVTVLQNERNAQGYDRDLDFEFGFRLRPWEIALLIGVGAALILVVWKWLTGTRRMVVQPAA